MSHATESAWKAKRTAESIEIEEALAPHFRHVDAYPYNSASIRVRVIDPRFKDRSHSQRDALVEKHLKVLPPALQRKILTLLAITPEEADPANFNRYSLWNLEFEDPSRSRL